MTIQWDNLTDLAKSILKYFGIDEPVNPAAPIASANTPAAKAEDVKTSAPWYSKQ